MTLLLRTVPTTGLLSVFYSQCILGSSDDLVSHTGKITDSTSPNQHDGVFLQVVPFARDINRDLFAIGKPDTTDLAKSRIGLFGGHGSDLQTNALFLWTLFQDGSLGELAFLFSSLSEKLINRRHSFFYLTIEAPLFVGAINPK